MDAQRRRLTVSRVDASDSAAAGRRASGSEESSEERITKCGLGGLAKFTSLTSVTDADKHHKKSFASKEEEVLCKATGGKEDLLAFPKVSLGWSCKKGMKPESPNQDSFSLLFFGGETGYEYALYGVYDGHGPYGHDVSDAARTEVVKLFLAYRDANPCPAECFKRAFVDCQQNLKANKSIDASVSGSTCTMVFHDFEKDALTIAHVGDGRCVLGSRGAAGTWKVHHETEDHKPNLPGEKARIESAKPPGRVIFDGFYNHRVFSQKGMYPGLNMSRAFGDVVAHTEAGLTAEPDVKEISLKEIRALGDEIVMLICTDGVWEFIESGEALAIASKAGSIQEGTEVLAKESYQRWLKDSDGEISDDITSVMIKFKM